MIEACTQTDEGHDQDYRKGKVFDTFSYQVLSRQFILWKDQLYVGDSMKNITRYFCNITLVK